MTDKVKLKQGTWVLVCDDKKALLFQNAGDHVYPKLETRKVMEHDVHRSRDLGSDAPARSASGRGGPHAAMDEGDPHREEEVHFLRVVAGELGHRVGAHEITDLVIVAPARALGILRELLDKHVHGVTRAELAHDYVKLPVYEIEKHLQHASA